MMRFLRLLAGLASRVLTIVLVFASLLFLATGTGAGRDALRARSEAIATRLLGTGFTAELGRQSFGIGSTGTIEISWRDIRLAETGTGLDATKVARMTVGLRPLALLSGRLAIRSLSMSGATIDLTRIDLFRQPRGEDPGSIDAVLKLADTRLDALVRSGLDEVELSDITVLAPLGPGGGPFVSRIDEAAFDLSDAADIQLSALFGVDDVSLALSGNAGFDRSAKRLEELQLSLGPLDLGRIVPPGPADDRLDQRPFASNAKVSLRFGLSSSPDDPLRTATLSLGLASGDIQIGRGHAKVETAAFDVAYHEGSRRAVLHPALVVFDGFSMTLAGSADLRPDGAIDVRVDAGDLRSTVGLPSGSEAARTGSVALEGTIAFAPFRLDVPTVSIATASSAIDGSVRLDLGDAGAKTEVRLLGDGLSARDVKAFWPFNLAPNTRRWVLDHIRDAGTASNVAFVLDMTKARLGEAFRPRHHPTPDEMRLTLDYGGVAMGTVQSMAELEDVAGRLEVLGGDTTIRIDRAKVAGLPSIEANPSLATFLRTPPDAPHEIDFKLAVALTGDARDILTVASRPPLDALRTLDLAPEDVSGRASVTADVDFDLGDDVPRAEELKGYAVDVALTNASLAKPFEGRRLTNLTGPLSIVPGAVEGELKGEVDGLSSTIRFGQPFGPHPSVERRLSVDVALSGGEAAKRIPALDGVLEGPIVARLTAKGAPAEGFTATVDLTGTGIALPVIGWRKGKGVAAELDFDLLSGDGDTKLRDLRLKGDGFAATGDVVADAGGLVSADLAGVSFNPGDDVKLKVRRADNGYSFELAGNRFDARPFLADLRASLGERAAKGRAKAARQLDATVSIDRLTGFGGEELRDVSLNYAGSAGAIAALSMSGTDAGGGRFAIDVSPRGKDRSIEVRAADAGRLVDFGGVYGRMEGGALSLKLLGSSDEGYAGTLAAEDFTLVDEPRLSRLVGTAPSPDQASLSQAVGAPLRTERADFSHASAGIVYGRNGLRVTDGIIRGPVFGSSFSGTVYDARNRIDITGSFMPAYGLNGIFGKIPVLGQILGNGNEGGLIGITYRLAGAFESPTLEVNPISAIAPGIFRNIFAYGP